MIHFPVVGTTHCTHTQPMSCLGVGEAGCLLEHEVGEVPMFALKGISGG